MTLSRLPLPPQIEKNPVTFLFVWLNRPPCRCCFFQPGMNYYCCKLSVFVVLWSFFVFKSFETLIAGSLCCSLPVYWYVLVLVLVFAFKQVALSRDDCFLSFSVQIICGLHRFCCFLSFSVTAYRYSVLQRIRFFVFFRRFSLINIPGTYI